MTSGSGLFSGEELDSWGHLWEMKGVSLKPRGLDQRE